jgi:hypothetical protein
MACAEGAFQLYANKGSAVFWYATSGFALLFISRPDVRRGAFSLLPGESSLSLASRYFL